MIIGGLAIGTIEGAAIGFVAGAFAPAVGRKIKALWVKETQVVVKGVVNQYDTVAKDVKADAEKVASKL